MTYFECLKAFTDLEIFVRSYTMDQQLQKRPKRLAPTKPKSYASLPWQAPEARQIQTCGQGVPAVYTPKNNNGMSHDHLAENNDHFYSVWTKKPQLRRYIELKYDIIL